MHCAILELYPITRQLGRLVIVFTQPEQFDRLRTVIPSEVQIIPGSRERLIDFANILLYGKAHLAILLATCACVLRSTGNVIPMRLFFEFTENNDTSQNSLVGHYRTCHVSQSIVGGTQVSKQILGLSIGRKSAFP